jgi:hypothetical protein
VDGKAEIIMQFETQSKFLLRMLFISSKLIRIISHFYHCELYIENILNGCIVFFLAETDLENFCKLGEKVGNSISKKERETFKTGEIQEVLIEVVKYPPSLNIEKYYQWATRIGKLICGYIDVQIHTEKNPKYLVRFTQGGFFKFLLLKHSDLVNS